MNNFKMYDIATKQNITENTLEDTLMGIGFVPVIGEVADIALIIKFAKEERYFEAGLMLIALIPTIGDAAVKPFLAKYKRGGKSVEAFDKILNKNPAIKRKFIKIGKNINDSRITKLINDIKAKDNEMGNLLSKARKTLLQYLREAATEPKNDEKTTNNKEEKKTKDKNTKQNNKKPNVDIGNLTSALSKNIDTQQGLKILKFLAKFT